MTEHNDNSVDRMFQAWKFWVFMFNGLHMITTYGKTEEEARANLQIIANDNPEVNLIPAEANVMFDVESPFDLDPQVTDDETLKKLCVLVTHTIVKNDQCNIQFRNIAAQADTVATAEIAGEGETKH